MNRYGSSADKVKATPTEVMNISPVTPIFQDTVSKNNVRPSVNYAASLVAISESISSTVSRDECLNSNLNTHANSVSGSSVNSGRNSQFKQGWSNMRQDQYYNQGRSNFAYYICGDPEQRSSLRRKPCR